MLTLVNLKQPDKRQLIESYLKVVISNNILRRKVFFWRLCNTNGMTLDCQLVDYIFI